MLTQVCTYILTRVLLSKLHCIMEVGRIININVVVDNFQGGDKSFQEGLPTPSPPP